MRHLRIFIFSAIVAGVASWAHAGAERITFPADYRDTFTFFLTSDRADNNTVRDLYANQVALESATDGAPLDHGSQFVMEVYGAVVDENDEPVLDADGRMQKGALKALAVMQKEEGWGAAYEEDIRNGDWEYGSFDTAGVLKADTDTRPCMECHLAFVDDDYVIYFEDLQAKAQE